MNARNASIGIMGVPTGVWSGVLHVVLRYVLQYNTTQ